MVFGIVFFTPKDTMKKYTLAGEIMQTKSRLDGLTEYYDQRTWESHNRTMSMDDYVDAVYDKPSLLRSAYQRLYDCIMSKGTENFDRYRRSITHYKFFDKVGEDLSVYGMEENLMKVVQSIRGAAGWYGPDRRLLLLHGPVGSAKSTICRCFKKGLEDYSKTDAGEMFTFKWVNLPSDIYVQSEIMDPMHSDPIKLLPWDGNNNRPGPRRKLEDDVNTLLLDRAPEELKNQVNKVKSKGHLNPFSQFIWDELMLKYNGDWRKILTEHIKVVRFVINEAKRHGIGTFQPKDEKNQDSTELTGDINYAMLGQYGIDSDPRAFGFDGELQRANRGIMEFIEVLKLAKEFLYDLLGACQEKQIKPKKFSQIDIDLVLFGHTNRPDYQRVAKDETMEALKDRTIRLDIPYVRKWGDEVKVLEQEFNPDNVRQHIAPHTVKIAALVTVLSRLKQPKKGNMNPVDKAKLYDGRNLENFNEDYVKELMDEYPEEGMDGLSVRYGQNKFSNCLSNMKHRYVNGFMVLNEMEEGLKTHALIENEDQKKFFGQCIDLAKEEYEEMLKGDVQDALVLDDNAMNRLLANYLDNVDAYVNKAKVFDPYTNREIEPDERLMRSVESKAEIQEQMAPDFRRGIAAQIGSLMRRGGIFDVKTNPKLEEALRMKLFEDVRDSIKVGALAHGATVVEPHVKEKIDAVRQRLIKHYGYNEESASDTLNFVASIFARGDLKRKKKSD
jgi:serine protein kinase